MKLLLCSICFLLILPVSSLSGQEGNTLAPYTFGDTTKNQSFSLDQLNSSYILLILFDLRDEEWILKNGSLIYDCFDHNELELVTLYLDRSYRFNDFSHCEGYWDYKCELYNIIPDWYFGYVNDRAQITEISNLYVETSITIFLLDSNLEIVYLAHELDIQELFSEVAKYVEITSTPKELQQYLKNPKKVLGFLVLIPILSLTLLILKRKYNEI